jgi:hypothetical protein
MGIRGVVDADEVNTAKSEGAQFYRCGAGISTKRLEQSARKSFTTVTKPGDRENACEARVSSEFTPPFKINDAEL